MKISYSKLSLRRWLTRRTFMVAKLRNTIKKYTDSENQFRIKYYQSCLAGVMQLEYTIRRTRQKIRKGKQKTRGSLLTLNEEPCLILSTTINYNTLLSDILYDLVLFAITSYLSGISTSSYNNINPKKIKRVKNKEPCTFLYFHATFVAGTQNTNPKKNLKRRTLYP